MFTGYASQRHRLATPASDVCWLRPLTSFRFAPTRWFGVARPPPVETCGIFASVVGIGTYMENGTDTPTPDSLVALAESGDGSQARAALERLEGASDEQRRECLRTLRSLADERPAAVAEFVPALERFLSDDDRSVRLATAKAFVPVAAAQPAAVVPTVSTLADRLADEFEFYFVRARAAEALGYVAREHVDAVATPETLADLRVGLTFDEPEVREQLAKALAFVATGDPERLRHQADRLVDGLDDEQDLVRYYLATALVAVGTVTSPSSEVVEALAARLDDERAHVRGRAAEALAVLDLDDLDGTDASFPAEALEVLRTADESFVADRARVALDEGVGDTVTDDDAPLGTLASVRATAEPAADAMQAPDAADACPHCGLDLPDNGPPLCPGCGMPQ